MSGTESEWQVWLRTTGKRFPTTARQALPHELLANALILANNPLVDPIDATGYLSLGRLEVLIEAMSEIDGQWIVGYWDGWSDIATRIESKYGQSAWVITLPNRGYLCVQATPRELLRFSHETSRYIGPSLLAALGRSALLVSDTDWPVTVLGLRTSEAKDNIRRIMARHGMPIERSPDLDEPLSGYNSIR